MEKENKSQKEQKIQKKAYFTLDELAEIEKAMNEEGFKGFSAYALHMTRTRKERTDAEQRRKQMYSYRCARIQTLNNKLKTNVDVPNTMKAIMMEVDALCREFV